MDPARRPYLRAALNHSCYPQRHHRAPAHSFLQQVLLVLRAVVPPQPDLGLPVCWPHCLIRVKTVPSQGSITRLTLNPNMTRKPVAVRTAEQRQQPEKERLQEAVP